MVPPLPGHREAQDLNLRATEKRSQMLSSVCLGSGWVLLPVVLPVGHAFGNC